MAVQPARIVQLLALAASSLDTASPRSRVGAVLLLLASRLAAAGLRSRVAAAVLLVVSCLAAGCGGTQSSTPSAASATSSTPKVAGGGLVARGATLYQEDGCSSCHSLNGTRMTGPSWKGLAGSRVTLSDGRTVIADNAYLTRHIVEPDALTVRGYPGEVMKQAIEALHLKSHPAELRALVAFIDSLR
jgi:Cytochrome c